MNSSVLYSDSLITIDESGITIASYYFPLGGEKAIKWADIKNVRKVPLTLLNGKLRLWGGGIPLWFNNDLRRPFKKTRFDIELGEHTFVPAITPDRPDQVESILRTRGLLL